MPGDSNGFTDLHSHLVPGVDDGSRTLQEARDGLRRFEASGVRQIVTTPHLDGSLTRDRGLLEVRLAKVDEAWGSLRRMAAEEFPDLELHRGHEVMLDIPDPDLSDPRVHLAGTPYVLVEWPGLQVPPSTLPVLDRLVDSGIKPIIAHPERYRGLGREVVLPGEWRARGALLQVNHGSVLGKYGDLPRRRAVTLLERGWVDLMASDFHGRAHLSPSVREAQEVFLEWGGRDRFDLLARVNPARILRGEDPMQVIPLTVKKRAWQRLRETFQPNGGR
ncbi:MAG: CpsB/CapC family capsule biosynthesis tyrosine phosphatase [Gemmatimonadota bacterium]